MQNRLRPKSMENTPVKESDANMGKVKKFKYGAASERQVPVKRELVKARKYKPGY